jgi:hypothetical protein
MVKKIDTVHTRGYIKPGPVVSLTSYFAVDKDVTDNCTMPPKVV